MNSIEPELVPGVMDFLSANPQVLTTAIANAHKFVPERVFTLGGDGAANSLLGAAGILGDFLSDKKGDESRAKNTNKK